MTDRTSQPDQIAADNSADDASMPERPRTYRKSSKREETQRRNRELVEAAAWEIFATKGYDAATARDIISVSGVSPGTFYNSYKTLDTLFEVTLTRLIQQVNDVTTEARAGYHALDQMLIRSNRAFLDLISSIPLGREFCERNQHHIRASLYTVKATAGLLEGLHSDLISTFPDGALSSGEQRLVSALILSTGLEALFLMTSADGTDAAAISQFITRLTLHGLQPWAAGDEATERMNAAPL